MIQYQKLFLIENSNVHFLTQIRNIGSKQSEIDFLSKNWKFIFRLKLKKIDHKGHKFIFWTKNDKIRVYRSKNYFFHNIIFHLSALSEGRQGFSNIKYYPHGKSSIMSASHFELAQMIPVERPTKPNPLPIFIEGG